MQIFWENQNFGVNTLSKNVEIMVPLKNLSNFWRILEMPLINCEINVYLNWPQECVTMATAVTQIKAELFQ